MTSTKERFLAKFCFNSLESFLINVCLCFIICFNLHSKSVLSLSVVKENTWNKKLKWQVLKLIKFEQTNLLTKIS